MKKYLFLIVFSFIALLAKSQTTKDSVMIGPSYANQVWYSLPNDSQSASLKNNWDLAFDLSGFGSSVYINSITGTTLWLYPKKDTAAWNSIDTSGITKWSTQWNSDTSWVGAMGKYANSSDPYDLGWGKYNLTTHAVTGDSIYIVKLANGNYKKLWIQSLSGGAYTFKYADLNNSNEKTGVITKSDFTGKNLAYYSMQNDKSMDREPKSSEWDLFFGQYTTFIPSAYTVTGILQNKGVRIAEVKHVDASTYSDYSTQTFSTNINIIGYDWKTFTGTAYKLTDSLLYFVKRSNGDIWKLVMTGFGGSSTGKFVFSKSLLLTSGIEDENKNTVASIALYPNPSTSGNATLVYNLEQGSSSPVALSIYDIQGKKVFADYLNAETGLHQYPLYLARIQAGVYLLNMQINGQNIQQRLIIQ